MASADLWQTRLSWLREASEVCLPQFFPQESSSRLGGISPMGGKSLWIFVMGTLPEGDVLVGAGQGPWTTGGPQACGQVCGDHACQEICNA